MTTVSIVILTFCALSLSFAGIYLWARHLDNYGIVDIAWSYAFGLTAIFYALAGPGWLGRRAVIASMVVVWSLRLGTHLWIRIAAHHPVEDGRYQQLRSDWAQNFALKMFGFFQMQAASVIALGVGFLVISLNPDPAFHPLEIAGGVLWIIAMIGEASADAQLAAFKRRPDSQGKVCDVGLWHFSRHPNYFFEWLVWVAYFVFALASPWGCLGIIGPASILWLLLRVTGIPMTEEQSLRSRGDAYRRYQRTTSAFIPWFPKKPSA
ncbi:MAG: DUF1295 domain-containing protein [Opitutaceae bacterium]